MSGVVKARLTAAQMLIAAEMLEAKKFSLTADTTNDQLEAASFIFDNGIMYGGPAHCDAVAVILRAKAEAQS